MVKKSKPNLKKALKKVKQAPDELFGSVEVNINELPCLKKPKKEKITANFDSDLLNQVKTLAKKYGVPYQTLMNDALRKVFLNRNH